MCSAELALGEGSANAMKPTTIFTLGLVATLVTMLLEAALHADPAVATEGLFSDKSLALCVLLGALLQLSTLANSGPKRLQLVSVLWMLAAMVLAASQGTQFLILVGLFFAGAVLPLVPTEKPAAQPE